MMAVVADGRHAIATALVGGAHATGVRLAGDRVAGPVPTGRTAVELAMARAMECAMAPVAAVRPSRVGAVAGGAAAEPRALGG